MKRRTIALAKTMTSFLLVLLSCATVQAQTAYKKDDSVDVYETAHWYPAQILSVESGDKYRVRYRDYGPSWDATVEGSRLRRRGDTISKPLPKPSAPVKTDYRVGDRVGARGEDEGGYYAEASIVEISGGKYKVRWERSDSPDEWKMAAQLRPFDFGKTAGGPKPGKYACYLIGASMGGQAPRYTGTLEILPKGKYRYMIGHPAETGGTYTFNEQTRHLTWATGSIAKDKGMYGEYSNTEKDGPFISMVFPPGKQKGSVYECKHNGKVIHFIDSPYKY